MKNTCGCRPTVTTFACPRRFTNRTPIFIPATGTEGPASPYPSTIRVSGVTGTVGRVTVKLINLSHTFPDDIDILLVGPRGQNAIIMSDVGGSIPPGVGVPVTGVTLILDDRAPTPLPAVGPLVSGTFQPTNLAGVFGPEPDVFPPPAPTPSGNSALSIFNSTNPNGVWSLFVFDDFSGDTGRIMDGWELTITTCGCTL